MWELFSSPWLTFILWFCRIPDWTLMESNQILNHVADWLRMTGRWKTNSGDDWKVKNKFKPKIHLEDFVLTSGRRVNLQRSGADWLAKNEGKSTRKGQGNTKDLPYLCLDGEEMAWLGWNFAQRGCFILFKKIVFVFFKWIFKLFFWGNLER